MTIVRFVARPLLASSYIASGVDRLKNSDNTAEQLRPVLQRAGKTIPSARSFTANEQLVAKVVGGTQIGAGLLLGIGKLSRVAALLLVVSSALNTVVEYRSADSSTKEAKTHRRNELLKNVSLIGAVMLATVDTNGRPGLAWRAEHLAGDARKSAKSLSKDARKQWHKADKGVRSTASGVFGS